MIVICSGKGLNQWCHRCRHSKDHTPVFVEDEYCTETTDCDSDTGRRVSVNCNEVEE